MQSEDADGFEVLGSDMSDPRTLTPPGPLIMEEKRSPERLAKMRGSIGLEEGDNDADAALRESIKGLYTLWTMRRGPGETDIGRKERFLGIVRGVLDSTS